MVDLPCFALDAALCAENGGHRQLNTGTDVLLDRQQQLAFLKDLAAVYPSVLVGDQMIAWENQPGFYKTAVYLQEHGLISASIGEVDTGEWYAVNVRATAKGMDFLADDGGLTAILGVMTVRLHDDTIKSLIEAKILASDLPEPEKKRFVDHLKALPAEATKHVVMKLLDLGLASGPQAIALIGKLLAERT